MTLANDDFHLFTFTRPSGKEGYALVAMTEEGKTQVAQDNQTKNVDLREYGELLTHGEGNPPQKLLDLLQ